MASVRIGYICENVAKSLKNDIFPMYESFRKGFHKTVENFIAKFEM